jgi:hypothetical protein
MNFQQALQIQLRGVGWFAGVCFGVIGNLGWAAVFFSLVNSKKRIYLFSRIFKTTIPMITNTTIQSIGSLYHQFQIECILQEDPFELYAC